MPVTMVAMGRTLVDGPRRRTSETLLEVVGCQEMVKALQAGTISFRGRVMGLPDGWPTGACWAAARPAKRAMMEVLANMLMVLGIM
jgi:hypothetical protein